MIVATAGHVDHGKTALVRALTGVDTDRLPEERKRGLTIDLGFAYQALDDGHVLGFVDVPGHERFVRNMLAGVGSIDLALVVVAADDGVMPQTSEHTAILDLLGVTECIAVVSKVDKVETARAVEVEEELEALLSTTGMRGAEIHRVSAMSGAGMDALSGALRERARGLAARAENGRFRLCVDRAFMLKGAGLVVTGTVHAGVVGTGERLVVTPSGYDARIRGIHAQDRPADRARAGERCALNLAGRDIESGAIARGDWIVDRALHAPSDRIDARLQVLADEPRALRHWTPVHAHLAASHSTARVAVLGAGSIAPGDSGRVQIVLDKPIHALAGDRLVIRDQSATRTMGGGAVIDPFSPKRGRARPARLAWLDAIELRGPGPSEEETSGPGVGPDPKPDPESHSGRAVTRVIASTGTGVDTGWIRRAFGVTEPELERMVDATGAVRVPDAGSDRCFSPTHWSGLQDEILDFLETFHRERPRLHGANANDIRLGIARRVGQGVVEHALASIAATGPHRPARRHGPSPRAPCHAGRERQTRVAAGRAHSRSGERQPSELAPGGGATEDRRGGAWRTAQARDERGSGPARHSHPFPAARRGADPCGARGIARGGVGRRALHRGRVQEPRGHRPQLRHRAAGVLRSKRPDRTPRRPPPHPPQRRGGIRRGRRLGPLTKRTRTTDEDDLYDRGRGSHPGGALGLQIR